MLDLGLIKVIAVMKPVLTYKLRETATKMLQKD